MELSFTVYKESSLSGNLDLLYIKARGLHDFSNSITRNWRSSSEDTSRSKSRKFGCDPPLSGRVNTMRMEF